MAKPTRERVLDLLETPRSPAEVASALDITHQAARKHFASLEREARITRLDEVWGRSKVLFVARRAGEAEPDFGPDGGRADSTESAILRAVQPGVLHTLGGIEAVLSVTGAGLHKAVARLVEEGALVWFIVAGQRIVTLGERAPAIVRGGRAAPAADAADLHHILGQARVFVLAAMAEAGRADLSTLRARSAAQGLGFTSVDLSRATQRLRDDGLVRVCGAGHPKPHAMTDLGRRLASHL